MPKGTKTRTGTTKLADTQSAPATSMTGEEQTQVRHLNKKIVKEWLGDLSEEDRKEMADFAADTDKSGSQLT